MAIPNVARRRRVKGGKTRTNQAYPQPVRIVGAKVGSPSTHVTMIFDQPIEDGAWGTGLLNFVQGAKTVDSVVGRPAGTTNQIEVIMSAAVTAPAPFTNDLSTAVQGLRMQPVAAGSGIITS